MSEYFTTHINSASHSASQFLIYSCIYSLFHSLINATLHYMTGECHDTWQSDEYELTAVVTAHTHLFIKSYIYSLLSVPLAFIQAVTHLFSLSRSVSVSHSVCISPLFSLLRHSWEKRVSADLLCGKIGEFKGQLHVTPLFFLVAIVIVINAARLENKSLLWNGTGP